MKQYHRLKNGKRGKGTPERVFDCMNSWGFKQPIITIEAKHDAILGIYKITPTVTILKKLSVEHRAGAGAQGGSATCVYGEVSVSEIM